MTRSTELKKIVEAIRGFPGVTRKHIIKHVVEFFPWAEVSIQRNFGEDAAVLIQDGKALLLAADGIMESLMREDPVWAGYCAVLVNVNDIAAMGGTPLAMVDVISMKSTDRCALVMEGVRKGVEKFGVPIVGGHTHPDCDYDAIDISILGTAEPEAVIYSDTARPGDVIIAAVDTNGRVKTRYSFDTTTFKSPEIVRAQVGVMAEIGRRGLVTAGKDISNPGIAGTLGMLLETSGVGGVLDIDRLPTPDSSAEIPLSQWLMMYQGFGFVLTAPFENADEIIRMFGDVRAEAAVVGEVKKGHTLTLGYRGETMPLFDFQEKGITGLSPENRHLNLQSPQSPQQD